MERKSEKYLVNGRCVFVRNFYKPSKGNYQKKVVTKDGVFWVSSSFVSVCGNSRIKNIEAVDKLAKQIIEE